MENYLVNPNNYFMYADMTNSPYMKEIYVPATITRDNIDDHINAIYALIIDGLSTEFLSKARVRCVWDKKSCRLNLVDYWYSLFMWYGIICTEQTIQPRHVFVRTEFTSGDIAKFVDRFIATKENKMKYTANGVSRIIAAMQDNFRKLDCFADYLAISLNNEDDIDLMRACPEYYDLMHFNAVGYPVESVNDVIEQKATEAWGIIMDSKKYLGYEHSFANAFRAKEGIKKRQYREVYNALGIKPDGQGGVLPLITQNYINTGITDYESNYSEAQVGRTAQTISKRNVGRSGHRARILKLNNINTTFRRNQYPCNSANLVAYTIKSTEHLRRIDGRNYQLVNSKYGIKRTIDRDKDANLVGQTVYLHSPITCHSHVTGEGYCSCCYGEDLFYTNYNINPGLFASEQLSSQLTQRLLSAKHLLEARVIPVNWNEAMNTFITVDTDILRINQGFLDTIEESDIKKYAIVINMDDIELLSEESDTIESDDDSNNSINLNEYNECITSFTVRAPGDNEFTCGSKENEKLIITPEFKKVIADKTGYTFEGVVSIPFNQIQECPLFTINIANDEISKTMEDIFQVINNNAQLATYRTTHDMLQDLIDKVIEGGLEIQSVHLEVILSNQITNPESDLYRPDWSIPNVPYKLNTLNHSLTNNPAVVTSLMYKDLGRTFTNPQTFEKTKSSAHDVFLMTQPQMYLSDEECVVEKLINDYDKLITPAKFVSEQEVNSIVPEGYKLKKLADELSGNSEEE